MTDKNIIHILRKSTTTANSNTHIQITFYLPFPRLTYITDYAISNEAEQHSLLNGSSCCDTPKSKETTVASAAVVSRNIVGATICDQTAGCTFYAHLYYHEAISLSIALPIIPPDKLAPIEALKRYAVTFLRRFQNSKQQRSEGVRPPPPHQDMKVSYARHVQFTFMSILYRSRYTIAAYCTK